MRIAGEATVHAPVDRVWDALLDPSVLVRTIPGCERLEATGENAYDMTVTAGVAAIKGTYAGTCLLRDLRAPESLVLVVKGAGAPGTIAANVQVRFGDNGDETTTVGYEADAVVGGMIGGVGQRMLGSVSKRMAGEFFGAVDRVLAGGEDGVPVAQTAGRTAGSGAEVRAVSPGGGVFTRPAPDGGRSEFLTGVAVGAGLVLLGVLAGAVGTRRR